MVEPNLGERVARMEGVLEQRVLKGIERMETKLDEALEEIKEKASRPAVAEAHEQIDAIQIALKEKADKEAVEVALKDVRADVKQVRERMLVWTGGLAALFVLGNWVVPKLVGLLMQ